MGNGDGTHSAALEELLDVLRNLLGPDGCPWDREQTLDSLRPFLIEEAFEVVDTIDRNDDVGLKEELGDLLMLVLFLAELARQRWGFDVGDVMNGVAAKLVRRHPWVFGGEDVGSSDGAVDSWEAIKAKERQGSGRQGTGRLAGVPRALPALLRAVRVGEKASRAGYDWPDATGARAKVDEELAELDGALQRGDKAEAEAELGDALFALSSVARKEGIDPEAALRGALDRFTARFERAEAVAASEGRPLEDRAPSELDALWTQVKNETA